MLSGRYGPYIKHEDTNANVPKGVDPSLMTLEEAVPLLAARESAPTRKKTAGRKPAVKKAVTAKTAAPVAAKTNESKEARRKKEKGLASAAPTFVLWPRRCPGRQGACAECYGLDRALRPPEVDFHAWPPM